MNFKELYKVIALTYCARVQSWGENDEAAKNLLCWLHNLGCIGAQLSNYPNHGDCALCLSNDLYKAGLRNIKVYDYLNNLRNSHNTLHLHNVEFMSKLPKIVWA